MNDSQFDDSPNVSANPGYAVGQLGRALSTSKTHADPTVRANAVKKAAAWLKVVTGMNAGEIRVGSRTPVAAPAWATLEVVHGGFATGGLLAGGPLLPHERLMLKRLGSKARTSRAELNAHCLSEQGVAELSDMLASGRYRIDVPEEGALLTAVWLLENGRDDEARALLDTIAPYFETLRFYPAPAKTALADSRLVHITTVGQARAGLRAMRTPANVQVLRDVTQVWIPFGDRLVELFLETVSGPNPSLRLDMDGKPLRTDSGSFAVEGGWPCQSYAEGWRKRAAALLGEYRALASEHQPKGKIRRKGANFARLLGFLEICADDPAKLTGRDVGMIRMILAHIAYRRGLPGSERCERLRSAQRALAALPSQADLGALLALRLSDIDPSGGLEDIEPIVAPVTLDEARRYQLPEGHKISAHLSKKVIRAHAATPETLIAEGVISSGEVLAKAVSRITAHTRSEGFDDPVAKRLYAALYLAFRQRRSLLLLNLESQVRFEELPWIAAMEAQRRNDHTTHTPAKETLRRVASLALTAFPQQILPNKLLKEIQALATDAALAVPVVDEVAADIFMGAFGVKFLRAAQIAGGLLEGTLYERYYGIPYARIQQINDGVKRWPKAPETSAGFLKVCEELAGPSRNGSPVASNGKVIEQEQILTTHNLATLFVSLDLQETLGDQLEEMSRQCFSWILRTHRQTPPNWHARLQQVKNSAYAWRQMVFFLALLPIDSQKRFLAWASESIDQERGSNRERFRPALDGLRFAVEGVPAHEPNAAHRFLGWTMERHWLMQD